MLHDPIARVGPEIFKNFGRLIVEQIVNRLEAAQAVGVKAPTLILLDHEFAAFVYFLAVGHGAFTFAVTTDGKVEGPASDPTRYASDLSTLGILRFRDATVVSEGRAMAEMREQAAAVAAAGSN